MSQAHPPSDELFAYRDGELDHEQRALIEAHVLSCTSCQARIDALSDAEGALREQTPEPDAAYYGRLTDAVLARVAKESAGRPEAHGAERSRRRRRVAEEPRGRAPGLPWPAIVSTVSAAAAVVVVAVLLFQRQDAWRGADTPVLSKSTERNEALLERETSEADGALDEGQAPSGEDTPTAPRQDAAASEAPSTVADALGTARDDRMTESAAGRGRAGEIRTQSATEALPEVAARRFAAEKKADEAGARAAAPSTAAPIVVGDAGAKDATVRATTLAPTYADILARHGLPSLFDPLRAGPAAVLRSEQELRRLYVEGRAGEDSARVRLYLAEAARARAGEDLDGETFDAIIHHYRRAIQLARDAATSRVARQRLDDFVSKSAPRE